MHTSLAAGLAISGVWLARGKQVGRSDYENWLLAAIMLVLVAAAERLTLLDGQLLALASLLLLWWGAARRSDSTQLDEEPRRSVVGTCGLIVLLMATAVIGMLAVAKVIADFAWALRSAPGGFAALSWIEALMIIADVARSRPSLGGLRELAPTAWITGFTAVAILWITVLPGRFGRIASMLIGWILVGGAVLAALFTYSLVMPATGN
jgi:hypothetical protein